jgi:AcrR family transcriptional regulator
VEEESTGKRRSGRAPVTRDRVLGAAMAIADRGGLDGVTMRAVAKQLGVEAMSLYKHVVNKEDLLDGLVECVMQELEPPAPTPDWRAGLRLRARGLRAVLLRHRWAAMLIESRTVPTPARLRYHDASLRLLREAGFTVELAYNAILSMDSYIYGFVAQEVWWPFEPEERPEVIETLAPDIAPAQFPYLVEMMGFVMSRAASPSSRAGSDAGSYAADFDFGLELLLDGLARARCQAP